MSSELDPEPGPPPSLVPPAEPRDVLIPDLPPPPRVATFGDLSSLMPPPPTSSIAPVPGSFLRPEEPRGSRPAPIRSLPPLPEVQPLLDAAADAREKKHWETALEAYKKALFVVPPEAAITQASIYASVAEVKRVQGKTREAETNYEKSLVINPKHLRSIDGLVTLATEASDWARLAAARRRRAEAFEDPDDKASELCIVAEIEEVRLKSVDKALATLEIAAIHRSGDPGILVKLKDLYAATRQWERLLETLDELVRTSGEPRQRGSFRFAQADVVLGRLSRKDQLEKQEPRGLAFLELALDEDPQSDRALSALVAVRTRREEWPELGAVYERLIDRFAGIGDRERAWEVCKRLGTLRRDRLHDGPGALEALEGAVELRPDDIESRASLAELHAAKGQRQIAVRELEIVSARAPTRAQTYRRLFELHERAGRVDRAWLVATCLEELGASDMSHELLIEQFRPEGPIRPLTAVDDAWWDELLVSDGADPIVHEILAIVGETAIAIRLEELHAKKKLVILDPARKQDPGSTASVIRTFIWAARALGVKLPDLYSMNDVPSGIAAVPVAAPATALGPQVLAGRSVQELAFLAGRHLTYYRAGHYPLVFFPTLADLSALVLASVRLVVPGITVPPPAEGGSRVGDVLGERLAPEAKDRLAATVSKLNARGGRLDLLAWIRSIELTASRAGLLLAGDLRTAMRLTKDERRAIADLSPETKRGDLLGFCASEAYGQLRERMGIASNGSKTRTE